jgi:arginase family enzyme
MSRLRARCPDCGTYTAVSLGSTYECHACGRTFGAGLVRIPRAWGDEGEAMAEAAHLALPYPEAGVIEADTLAEQTFAVAADLPDRPLVLGGCCCSHVGAVEGLAARRGRIALVWLDAHGDLNTPESSPSGNAWGMPLRMLLDSGAVEPADVVLIGARNLDPPELEFIAATGLRREEGLDEVLAAADGVYVAFDADVVEPGELSVFMPEPAGLMLDDLEGLMRRIARDTPVIGAGLTGLRPAPANVEPLARLCSALGL